MMITKPHISNVKLNLKRSPFQSINDFIGPNALDLVALCQVSYPFVLLDGRSIIIVGLK